MDDCTYSPEISLGNPNYTPIPDTGTTFVARSTTLFQYPFTSPTTTLELRNPEFNDKRVLQVSRINRYTRAYSLNLYRDTNWPKMLILNWNFTGLSQAKADDIIDFCRLSAGAYIKVTAFDSREYKMLIINPDNPVTQEGRGFYSDETVPVRYGDKYTWKCDLQGNKV